MYYKEAKLLVKRVTTRNREMLLVQKYQISVVLDSLIKAMSIKNT